MSAPLVSIAMPVRNCARFVRVALASIQAQTVGDWELLLFDDGSTDGTLDVAGDLVGDPRIKVLADGRHRGLWHRLNEALELSRGRYFARMDGDDVSYPERLERQLAILEAEDTVDLVGAQMLVIDEAGLVRGERRGPLRHEELCRHPSTGFRLFHPTYCGRVEWFRRWSYRESTSEDQDLLLRAHRSSRFANAQEVLLAYRVAPHLRLGRQCRCRFDYVRAVHECPDLGVADALHAALAHGARAAVEALAVALRVDGRVLRQRASPTSEAERARWDAVEREILALASGRDGRA